MKSVGSGFLKPLLLHKGPLDGSCIYRTPERLIAFGDVGYVFDVEDENYYHYNWLSEGVRNSATLSEENEDE